MLRQYPLSPAVGKRLIAKGIVSHPWVAQTLRSGVAGAEGGVWLAIEDSAENMEQVEALIREIIAEPLFDVDPVP
jgi:hypothetical protein